MTTKYVVAVEMPVVEVMVEKLTGVPAANPCPARVTVSPVSWKVTLRCGLVMNTRFCPIHRVVTALALLMLLPVTHMPVTREDVSARLMRALLAATAHALVLETAAVAP